MPSSSQTSRQVPLPAHRIEDQTLGLKIVEQVLDQVAAAVAGPFPVAILTGPVEVVEAGQVWDRDSRFGVRVAAGHRPALLARACGWMRTRF